MERLGALWIKKNKKGEAFLSGVFLNKNIFILKNKFKKNEKSPDYQIFLKENKYNYEQNNYEQNNYNNYFHNREKDNNNNFLKNKKKIENFFNGKKIE